MHVYNSKRWRVAVKDSEGLSAFKHEFHQNNQLISCRIENTVHLHYKNQSINII
jgi:hypothetical protein